MSAGRRTNRLFCQVPLFHFYLFIDIHLQITKSSKQFILKAISPSCFSPSIRFHQRQMLVLQPISIWRLASRKKTIRQLNFIRMGTASFMYCKQYTRLEKNVPKFKRQEDVKIFKFVELKISLYFWNL